MITTQFDKYPTYMFISQSKQSFPSRCVIITGSFSISIGSEVVLELRQPPHSLLMLYQIRIGFEVPHTDQPNSLDCFCNREIDDC